jgi:hypothetical protein
VVPRAPAAVSAGLKFHLTLQTLGAVDAATSARLWDALQHSGHPLARRLWWWFTKEEPRAAEGFHVRLAAVLLASSPPAWITMGETLVGEGLERREANALSECMLTLVGADGEWK